MGFTTFDLSTAEFPDATAPGSYADGMLVPDFATDGMVFWIPGMTRDLALWYTLVLDYEVTGDSPYTGRPRATAFSYRNDGDYASSIGSSLAFGDTGRKPVRSLVLGIDAGGNPDEERVAVFIPGFVPPITGVRWQASSPTPATGFDFPSAQDAVFGQTYLLDWDAMPDPSAENAVLGTPDAIGAAWFRVTLPVDGMLQALSLPNGTVYSGSSLGSLTYVADTGTTPLLDAGTYYVRTWSAFGGFSNYATLVGYAAESVFGPWTTPSPFVNDFTLGGDGAASSPIPDTTYLTQQAADAGTGGEVSTWEQVRVDSGDTTAPPFVAGDLEDVLSAAAINNPVTPVPPNGAVDSGWEILNSAFVAGPGSFGHRDYGGSRTSAAWFLTLRLPADPGIDALATGWENEDGSSDTTPTAVATTGDFEATFQHVNSTNGGGTFASGSWGALFAPVSGAELNVDGYVDYDVLNPTETALFTFGRDDDSTTTEDQAATIDLSGEGELFGFVQWYTPLTGLSEDESGHVGTVLSEGLFAVTYQAPDFRPRFDGIEVLLPLVGEGVPFIPPLRQYPRSDGLGASTVRRLYPPPPTIQASNRRGPSAIL